MTLLIGRCKRIWTVHGTLRAIRYSTIIVAILKELKYENDTAFISFNLFRKMSKSFARYPDTQMEIHYEVLQCCLRYVVLCTNKFTHAYFRALFVLDKHWTRKYHGHIHVFICVTLVPIGHLFHQIFIRNICRNSFDMLEKCWMSVLMSFLEHFSRQY